MNNEWENDVNWKVHTDNKKVYIMREHNWAFAAWELAKLDERIKEQSLVVHVDAHLDDVPDGVLVKNLLEAKTESEILSLSQGHDYTTGSLSSESYLMRIDNFIWASLARKTIEEVIYVSRYRDDIFTLEELREEETQLSKLIRSKLPINFNYKHQRFREIDDFLHAFDQDSFSKKVGNRSAILDLDLDVFNEVDDTIEPVITPLFQVRDQVERLLNLYPWDIITIAISPIYCGGHSEAELLLDNVLKVMNIEITDLSKWQ
ncbi:UPF0489 family protein [Paenibacillus brasilensis]|uniref:Uncharacterized protein n=1 Tax=Paenibacillus brasilensis TaxID=128574 RepID=A0ABU0L6S5_9BACL|nr:UPF0489 family protein [Paenibacillus brasilensis]MDQ0496925.1 hypothetical protein [Paenibacillus brasilensis]